MPRHEDQRSSNAFGQTPSGPQKPAEHPAKSVMDRRWEQRRAEATARWTLPNTTADGGAAGSTRAKRAAPQLSVSTSPVDAASMPGLLEDLEELERKTASEHSGLRVAPQGNPLMQTSASARSADSWLRNTPRVMLIVVLLSHAVLLALLYLAGFFG